MIVDNHHGHSHPAMVAPPAPSRHRANPEPVLIGPEGGPGSGLALMSRPAHLLSLHSMTIKQRASALPAAGRHPGPTDPRVTVPRKPGQRAAFAVAGFLVALLPLNTYWAAGGTWGVAWMLGCAGCTVPLALVWVQEAMMVAGIGIVLARAGIWRTPLPGWIWRVGLWTMAAAFGAVGAQNLLGDNTPQARFLFAPLALSLCVLCVVANRKLPAANAGTTDGAGARP